MAVLKILCSCVSTILTEFCDKFKKKKKKQEKLSNSVKKLVIWSGGGQFWIEEASALMMVVLEMLRSCRKWRPFRFRVVVETVSGSVCASS